MEVSQINVALPLSPVTDRELSHSPASSVHLAHSTVHGILPTLLERSQRDEYFRESLLADSKITVASMLSKAGLDPLPDFVSVSVLEDTDMKVNLVVPTPSQDFAVPREDNSSLLAILISASTDEELRTALVTDPHGTLERELQARGAASWELSRDIEINVEVTDAEKVVIVLPQRAKSNVDMTSSDESLFGAHGLADLVMADTRLQCTYTTQFCQTSFTNCGNGCGSSGCWTHTYECKRNP
jgi:hypothetical protein